MMPVGKLCGLAVIVVAIIPILLGMVWPNDTETIDVWEVKPGIDVTGDLASREVPVWDTYNGPLNNTSALDPSTERIQFPIPRDTTDIPNAYPVSVIDSTTTVASVTMEDLMAEDRPRIAITASLGFHITGDSATYNYGDYWPATNTLILYDPYANPIKTIAPKADDVISGTLKLLKFGEPTGYVDITQGNASGGNAWVWFNGMQNRSIEIWISAYNTSVGRFYCDTLQITWSSGTIQVTDGTTTANLGNVYEFVRIRMASDMTASVTGLIGVDSYQDRTYTEGNTIELTCSGHIDSIAMLGNYTTWWVESTVSAIGKTTGVKDSALSPEAYFGVRSWQVQIINPSTFGDALVFTKGAVVETYPITSGTITVTNLATAAQSSEAVRSMRILSLLEDGGQTIYINGIKAIHYANSGDVTVTFSGAWMVSVVAAKVVQSEQERYIWDTASFGFDQTSYCTVGMLGCALVAIVGSFWGKKNGESVAALYLTMGVCGLAYLIMIP